ncbi:MAG: ATP-binding protein [Planctomycetes bacterium]|nr:ATP-binding protein [Planctomycetota bacterium]
MANLKPWYRVEGCQPREDLRLNKPLNEADFAVNLDHIKRGESHPDYVKPHLFFARTFMTKALRELAAGTIRRLAGEQSETAAVYNMATQFGGGKTHALATLYHLANGGSAARDWPGVDQILTDAGVQSIPKAAVAVVVGTEFDPLTGRQEGNGPVRKTLWGEIAWQLGGEKSFAVVAEHEAKGMAPGGDVIRKMLPQGPALILLDEVINYMNRARVVKLAEQSRTFIFNLAEAARALSGVVVCVSVPKSAILEVTAADQEDYEAIKHDLNRLGKAIMMSADVEISEIIRRRLFDWKGLPKEGELAAQEYAAWVRENAGALTGIDPDRAYEQFKAAYPFHPAALSVFERKWQSLPRFQRTRGVLRLLALWVARAFQEDHRQQFPDPVIGLGSAPMDDPRFRAAVFEQLGSADLEGPSTTDIAGSANAHAVRLDKEATEAIKKGRLHQKVATTIFFESNGGQLKTEAALGEIKSAAGGPGVNMADVDHVLDGLITNCYYLNIDRNRYRFSVTPNVNKILTDRRAAVQPKQIDDLLRKEIEAAFRVKVKDYELDVRPFPERTNDVPDRPLLTLVVLHPERQSDSAATKAFMDKIVKECGNSGRTFKAAVIIVAADAIGAMKDAARDVLAWREIDEDDETKSRLDEGQRRQLTVNVGGSRKALEEAIWRAYRHIFLLNGENTLRLIDLGIVTRSQASSPTENLLNRLTSDDIVTGAPNPSKLVRWWPPALTAWPTKAVRDAFFTTPSLSRLKQPDLIKRSIADGVSRGEIGYARRKSNDQLELIAFNRSLVETDVEISDDVVVLKAEDAKKLLEPPRLARVQLSPDGREVAPGEIVTFTVAGVSQYGEPVEVGTPSWSATGGAIDATGKFVAGAEAGVFGVSARCGSVEGTAQVRVRVREKSATEANATNTASQMLLWTGEVPAQKWMNFYTKVLTRFASTPGLKLRVTFEAPADNAHAKGKADEARAALRELGLDDHISGG